MAPWWQMLSPWDRITNTALPKSKKLCWNDPVSYGEQMGGETHGIGWGAWNYHPGTVAGDQTDYGEYNVLILEYLATTASNPHPFNVQELLPIWKNRLDTNWKQWVCTQTKKTYQQVAQGVPVNKLGSGAPSFCTCL
jgi:hypothetical protein